MGGKPSKEKEDTGVYAELKSTQKDIPPIKLIINESITSTAVDSLKDSEEMLHLLAKNLIFQVLDDKQTPGKFGEFLQYIFTSDSILSTTRGILYWSLKTPDCTVNIESMSKYQLTSWMRTYGMSQVSWISQGWLTAPQSRQVVVSPLLSWVLRQKPYVIDPVAYMIHDSLPFARNSVKEGLKYVITENLKSESVKKLAKDAIVARLMKLGSAKQAAAVVDDGEVADSTAVSGNGNGAPTAAEAMHINDGGK